MSLRLIDIVRRVSDPGPWSEGDNIPWNDPSFSERMLREHLRQDHDAASRRFSKIDGHVEWLHSVVLAGRPTKILDLGCGPGLYATRLARLGHECIGIDYSPASVRHARDAARTEGLPCRYVHEDMRAAAFGSGYGLAMLLYGEFNVFRPNHIVAILRKAHAALSERGLLLLEPHTYGCVRRMGTERASWYATEEGLMGDGPHLCLTENVLV